MDQWYSKVTIEVSSRGVGGSESGSAGFALRGPGAGDEHTDILVSIERGEEIWFSLFPAHHEAGKFLHWDKSTAINTSPGATNRLAIILDGASCQVFVNGHFIGVYRGNDLPSAVQPGMLIAPLKKPITVRDFAIYPAPPSVPFQAR